jgi:hypothetical protein
MQDFERLLGKGGLTDQDNAQVDNLAIGSGQNASKSRWPVHGGERRQCTAATHQALKMILMSFILQKQRDARARLENGKFDSPESGGNNYKPACATKWGLG